MGLCHRQPLRSGALSDHSQQTRSGGLPGDTDGQTPGNEQQRVGLRHQRCPWRGTSGAPPLRRQNHARRHPRLRLLRPILQTPGAVQHGLGRRHPPLPPRDPRLPRRPGGNRRRRNPPQRRPRRRQPRRRLQTPGNRQLRLGLRHRPLWRGRGGLLPRRRRPAPGSARSHRQDGDPPSQPVLAARAQQPLLGLRPPGPSRRDGHPALRRGVGGDGTEAQSVRAAGREHGALVLRYGGVPRRGGLPPFHPSGHAGRAKVQAAGTQQHRLGPGDPGILPDPANFGDLSWFDPRRPLRPDVDVVDSCFAAVADEAMRRPHEFKGQELKDVLWSFSKGGVRHPDLFKAVAGHLAGRSDGAGRGFHDFSTQGIGNTAWAYAKQAQLVDAGSKSTGRLATYESSWVDIGGDLITRLFQKLGDDSIDRGLSSFKPQDLSNTCWAMATLGVVHRRFFALVGEEVAGRLDRDVGGAGKSPTRRSAMDEFGGQEVANILWSFATLNFSSDRLVGAIEPYVLMKCMGPSLQADDRRIAMEFNRQELANLVWSFSVLEHYPEELIKVLWRGLIGKEGMGPEAQRQLMDDEGLRRESVMSILQFQLAADIEVPHLGIKLPPGFPVGWGIEGDDYLSSMGRINISALQRSVSRAFARVGYDHAEEYIIGDSGGDVRDTPYLKYISIDLANEEEKVGVEVDGPAHFINVIDGDGDRAVPAADGPDSRIFDWKGGRQTNGPTALKHRLLTHLGWRVAHVPFWEWGELGNDTQKMDEYCLNLIEEL
mmetsp:Transcript_21470/g.48772  ORF Transcript_21470/g.48772 Transcript_21470/m.48772 type:complete len:769 (-) Transcript_21470:61-2367(-)